MKLTENTRRQLVMTFMNSKVSLLVLFNCLCILLQRPFGAIFNSDLLSIAARLDEHNKIYGVYMY